MSAHIDVSNPRLYRDDCWAPHFARLRREDPVHRHADSPYGPYWSVTRFADIMTVELDHETYSSASGLGGITIDGQPMSSFISMDPPRHTAQRRSIAPMLASTTLTNMERIVRWRTQAVLDGLPRNETFDWVDRVSSELTSMMLATLFDFPWADRRKLTHWADVSIANIEAEDALVKSEAEREDELMQMVDIIGELWSERTAELPKLDLISMLAHSEATQKLSLSQFIGTFCLLIVGGTDTTRNTMSGGLMAMIEHPAEVAKVRADAGLLPSLVSETIRYQTPVIHWRRTATRDTELGGKAIASGDKVVMWYVSGNRDDKVIDEPERFSVGRAKPRHHLSFGAGIHRCVGDRLAEMQLRILWEEFLKRDLAIELASPPVRLYSNFIRGIRALPVIIRG